MSQQDIIIELKKINHLIFELEKYKGKTISDLPADLAKILHSLTVLPQMSSTGLESIEGILIDLNIAKFTGTNILNGEDPYGGKPKEEKVEDDRVNTGGPRAKKTQKQTEIPTGPRVKKVQELPKKEETLLDLQTPFNKNVSMTTPVVLEKKPTKDNLPKAPVQTPARNPKKDPLDVFEI